MKFILTTLVGAFFMLSIVTACQTAAPVSVSKIPATDSKPATETAEEHADDDAPRIALADAKKDFDAGTAIFVDTRDAGSYNIEHIKGAINISAADLKEKIKTIPANKKIIAYCSWPSEHTSAGLVAELKKKGFNNAFALIGGTKAWRDAGYPMEENKNTVK